MPMKKLRTPLNAAFFYVAVLAGCDVNQPLQDTGSLHCSGPVTAIASVQGDATESPLTGQKVRVRGVVTLLDDGRGLYIEEPGSDHDEQTSNALFIAMQDWPDSLTSGSVVSASGQVSEIGRGRYSMTAITDIDGLVDCGSKQALPLTDVSLPLNGYRREALEGMRLAFSNPLTVTDVYRLHGGEFTLSGNGIQFVPTEVTSPGRDAAELQRQNKAFSIPARLAEGPEQPGLLAGGTTLQNVVGVLGHDGNDLRISILAASIEPATSMAAPEVSADGALRIVSMNLHNYFNGDGKGQGFPTPRGAETMAEFNKQRKRIGAAIKALKPHIVAVMELENDGFGDASSAQDFIRLATAATGGTWAASRPAGDNTGDDYITVGLFYRSDLVQAVGKAETLTGEEFTKSRQPMAQVFQAASGGEQALIVVNHFKSKGSCPDAGENARQGDGQGCWNPMRVASAMRMSAWAKSLAASAGTQNLLILGDLNAYRLEDPIFAMREAGFTELLDDRQSPVYSFVYRGQYGSLDYAFASSALLDKIDKAMVWNVNASYPGKLSLPQPWMRFSDHDPVVVDILLRQSSTSD